jgi:hypothetical protein
MTAADWLPIRYRGFYDIPRMVVVRVGGSTYLLDCPFDADRDEFPDYFDVYLLPDESESLLASPSWRELPQDGRRVGRLPVRAVEFDSSRRQSIRSSFLSHVVEG